MITWIEIQRNAILSNIKIFQSLLPKAYSLIPVIKSNAYGHGITEIAAILQESRLISKVAVVNLEEALFLRKSGIHMPILILSYVDWFNEQEKIEQGLQEGIEFPLYNEESYLVLERVARKAKLAVPVHIKIDTGTSRLGTLASESFSFIRKVHRSKQFRCVGLFTHLACAENPNSLFTLCQYQIFETIIQSLLKEKILFSEYHASATAALFQDQPSCITSGRLGIGLYGFWPSKEIRQYASKHHPQCVLRPALQWKTKIIQIKDVPAGTGIGYDQTYITNRNTRMAVLPVGYFEGYDRSLSNNSSVLIRGKRVRIIGRICMNICMIDITGISGVRVGDIVTLLGKDGDEEISAEELADNANTINYEIVSRINQRLPRIVL